jgi:hypothetical protein
MYFNQDILAKIKDVFESLEEKHKKETEQQITTELSIIFPDAIKRNVAEYACDSIFLSVERWNNSIKEFSEKDKIAINELFDKLSLTDNFFSNKALTRTKKIIDTKYIDSCHKEYLALMKSQKDTPALERKWQTFIKEKNWIFFYIFSQPIILHEDEAYVGGKTIDNKNGKFTDFLGKNNQTNNVALLEIKTHKTKLLNDRPYRGSDVFCASNELSGAINQVLNQKDILQKYFFSLQTGHFRPFNPTCVLLIGSIHDLTENQKESFELFRNNSKDVEIITYDELLDKIELFQNLMKRKE